MDSRKPISQEARGISFRLLVVAGVFLLCLFIFGIIANETVSGNENHLDQAIFDKLRIVTNPTTTAAMVAITYFGSSNFLLPAYLLLILYFILKKKDHKLSWSVAAVGITSTIILFLLKTIFHRSRPSDPLIQHVDGFSFPSGHSFSSFTFFGLLTFILWNQKISPALKWGATAFFFLFACTIAFSRVYLHVHYASDVIAGFCLCIVWLGISFWLIKRVESRFNIS